MHLTWLVNLFLEEGWDTQVRTDNDPSQKSSPFDSLSAGERSFSGFFPDTSVINNIKIKVTKPGI